ncbi:MAG: isocitrate/isopropylmalate family dehydrogenase [Burkholderiaceae bacterium]
MYKHIKVPADGAKITVNKDNSLNVPTNPIIPIEGDGTGMDITPVMLKVVDAAVARGLMAQAQDSLDGSVRGGENRPRCTARMCGCPRRPCRRSKRCVISIKGPLTTPVGGGIRSLNVALRQQLDLYVCLRPIRWFKGAVAIEES